MIEKWLSNIEADPVDKKQQEKLSQLTGVASKIEKILERKKQVILYGPPGTGKTYHAEKTSYELSARQLYKKSFHQLNELEKETLTGTVQERGTVSMCTFHPSYGYEEFYEGIKTNIWKLLNIYE